MMNKVVVLFALYSLGFGRVLNASVTLGSAFSYPTVPATLPVYQTQADSELVGRLQVYIGDRVHVVGDDVSFFTSDDTPVVISRLNAAAERSRVETFLSGILPRDLTLRRLGRSLTLMRQEIPANGNAQDAENKGKFFRMDRFIGLGSFDIPVVGVGSVAVVELAPGGLRSLVIRWNKVIGSTDVATVALTPCRLLTELLGRFPPDYDVSVTESPEVVYYDDSTHIVPMYRVNVVVNRHDGAHNDHETLFLSASTLTSAAVAGTNPVPCSQAAQETQDISVDRYVDNRDNGWIMNARQFRANLSNQRYRERSFCRLDSSVLAATAGYIDGSNVVLVEAHGKHGCLISGTCHALADAGGYGGTTDGLQLLILHSCLVIATSEDNDADWASRWRTIFKGLHTVVGYRSEMNIEDGVSVGMALRLTKDEPMIRGWFAEAAGAELYGQNSTNGLPAAVTLCNHDNDKPTSLAQFSTPTCLVMYWLKN